MYTVIFFPGGITCTDIKYYSIAIYAGKKNLIVLYLKYKIIVEAKLFLTKK